ncbi:MAG: endonuclease/exonuclease/phosphatase family protein, partial [Chlamydiae bacterium]|nr:endonuclease/exonuclease/phosphatase family protein [Chlamydiota bacterium]
MDRLFLDVSSKLTEPFCSAYSLFRYRLFMSLNPLLFDHSTTLTKEIAFRSILLVSAAFSLWAFTSFPIPIAFGILTIGSGSKLFRALGFVLQKNGHTHVLGNAREKSIEDIFKIMTWNIAGVPGGFHYDHAGVVHWQKRIDQIAQKIKKEDPDVLVLQEVYDTALAEALIKKLNNHYAHFFIHLGATTFGSESGCMVLSKCGIHRFSNTDFKTNGWTLKRGFSSLEIKKTPHAKTAFARIIGTHFLHDQIPERRQARILQISQIFSYLQRPKESLPTFLVGDLNIERDGAEGKLLSRYLHHTYT